MKKLILLCLALTHVLTFSAQDIQTQAGRDLEHSRLESERVAINKKFDAHDRDCRDVFAVTACRDAIKIQRMRHLEALSRQESILQGMARKTAAVKQQKNLDEKAAASVAAMPSKHLSRIDEKSSTKAVLDADQKRAAKRSAYEQKQQELAKRIHRRDENAKEFAEKQKSRNERRIEKSTAKTISTVQP